MQPTLDIGTDPRASRLGRLISAVSGRVNQKARLDATGSTGQVTTITASGGTEDAEYTARFRLPGVDETVTAIPGASTAAALVDALEAAIEGNALIMAHVAEIETTATTVVVTTLDDYEFVLTFPDNPSTHLSAAQVAPVDAPQYLWGRAVEVTSDGVRHPVAIDGAVVELTVGHSGSTDYTLRLLVDGQIETITWDAGGDAGATDAAAVAALEAEDFIVSAVADPEGTVTVTGAPGTPIQVLDADGSGAATLAASLESAADPLPQLALVVHDRATPHGDFERAPSGPRPGAAVLTATASGSSTYGVQAPSAEISGTEVWIETDGDDAGRPFDSASATRIPWPQAEWVGLDDADPTIAHIRL